LLEYLGHEGVGTVAPVPSGQSGASAGYWLNVAEQGRVFAALVAANDHPAADVLRLMLLTGVSCEDARCARFADVDLAQRRWRLPAREAPASHPPVAARRIVLGETAARFILTLRQQAPDAGFVAGAGDRAMPIDRVAAQWHAAAARAGIHGVDLYDLRPVLASELFRSLPRDLADRLLGLGDASAPAATDRPSPARRTPAG
jgi:integrase